LRVLIIAEVFLPKVDGVVIRTAKLIEYLQQQGDEVLVACPTMPSRTGSPVRLVEFPSFPFRAYPEYHIGRPDIRLVEAVQEFRPDVIHFLNPFAFGFRCYELLERAGIDTPCLFSFHTLYGEFVKRYALLKPMSSLLWRLTRHYHNCAEVNLTVSTAMLAELQQRQFQRVAFWPPAVDSVAFSPRHRSAEMRRRLMGNDREQQRPLLLTVSRLAPEKNVEFLARVLRRLPEARLAIVGDGPQRAALERQFDPQRTHFVGYLHGAELAAAYASCDAFLYASETETMGNVILEALASGLPTIAPAAGGIPTLMTHNETGLLYPPGNVDQAVRMAERVLDDEALRRRLGEAGRASIVRNGWAAAAGKVREHYAAVAQAGPHRRERRGRLAASLMLSGLTSAFRAVAPGSTTNPTTVTNPATPASPAATTMPAYAAQPACEAFSSPLAYPAAADKAPF
jgi:glycosyltransferase involved in cell wall biosynthesis